jgi:hypothetical protein
MKSGSFRHWCNEKWYEHKDELVSYGQPLSYDSRQYFEKYKYWLKREYRHQQRQVEDLCESYFSLP